MPFLVVDQSRLKSGDAASGYDVFFSPPPSQDELPTVWLDLHVGGEEFQACEDDHKRRPFLRDDKPQPYVRIRPRRGVRLFTREMIGLGKRHTAIVMNVAGRAKHGLIVAPGKIDPGFNPAPLVLVVFNQSSRVIKLRVGEKIACLAFAELPTDARPTDSRGHALSPVGSDFESRSIRRLASWFAAADWVVIRNEALRVIGTIAAFYATYMLGLRP